MKNLMMIILLAGISIFAMAQAPQQGPQQGPAARPRPQHTPEDRATNVSSNLTKVLVLNEKQKKQIHDLVLDKINKINSIREQNPNDRKAAHDQIQPIRADFDVQMKSILTADQYTKWEQMKADRKAKMEAHHQQHQQQQNAAPQQGTPPPPADGNDDIDIR